MSTEYAEDNPTALDFCHCFLLVMIRPQDVPGRRDSRRVLECLQRSLKIADVCITGGVNAQLFIEILNHYLYFFEADNPEVTQSVGTEAMRARPRKLVWRWVYK